MRVKFRSFQKGEEKTIRAMMWKLNREDPDELPLTEKKITNFFKYVRKKKDAQIFVCEYESRVLGFATLDTCFSIEYGGIWGVIDAIYLEKIIRNQGIGTKFLHWIEKYSTKKGYKVLYLETTPNNIGARRLYERLGFHTFPWMYYMKEIGEI